MSSGVGRVDGRRRGAHAPDLFATFVDVVSSTLVEPTSGGEELAARAHISRFHFDRIVTAAVGETPTRFRRRILLERAAYRLITRSRSEELIDIALEAGFSSHAAFTRAFARAYGVAPSRWRRRPSKFQIAAPSGVHFHPPGGLRLPSRRKVGSMDLVIRMVEHHIWLIGQMVERAVRLSPDQLDAALETRVEGIDGGSLRWLLSRLIGQLDMWNCAMDDREYDFSVEHGESVTGMRRRLGPVGAEFLRNVREVSEQGRYDETFVDAMRETPVVMTYGGMVAHVLTFAAHHRVLAVSTLQGYGVSDLGFGDPGPWVAMAHDDGA